MSETQTGRHEKGVSYPAGSWVIRARFVGFQPPKDWEIEGRKGTSYKVDLRFEEGTAFVKVTQDVYLAMSQQALAFGDVVELRYGRTVAAGELRVAVVEFHVIEKLAAA